MYTRACQVIMQHIQICLQHYTFGKPSNTYINWQYLSWDGWHSCHEVKTTERPQYYRTLTGRNPRHLVTIKMHRNQHNWHLTDGVDIAWWGQHLPQQNQLTEDHSSNSTGNKHKLRPVIKNHATKIYGEVNVKLAANYTSVRSTVKSTPGQIIPKEKSLWYPVDKWVSS